MRRLSVQSDVSADRATGQRDRCRPALAAAICGAALCVAGCAVVSVASTAATLTVGVVSTAVDVGVGAVKVTGKVIGKGIDVATGSAGSGTPAPAEAVAARKPAN